MASNSIAINKPDPTRCGIGARRAPAEAFVRSLLLGSELYTWLYLAILLPRVVHSNGKMYSAAVPTVGKKDNPDRGVRTPGLKRSTVGL